MQGGIWLKLHEHSLALSYGWDIRNLRMVANILATVRDQPGQRVLSVVGNSHKPWFDAWLGQASGMRVVDALEVLE